MALLDVIEWFDETGEAMVQRIPESGSAETKLGSQLVVRENQVAIFFRDGKGLDVLGPGRHTLSTANIPLLTKVLSLPFGFKSPFRVEVVFVNQKVFSNMKWGTKEPVAFRDTELGYIYLRAFGNYTMRISEPLLFVNTLVGSQGAYSTDEIDGYLKDVVVSRFNDLLGENLDTLFNLPKVYDELGVGMKVRLGDDFQKYGIELLDFFINSITPPEEVKQRINERAGMNALGNLNQYMQFKTATAIGDAAQASGEGGTAGQGMGLGLGAGFGMMMPQMVAGAMQAGQQPAPGGGGAAPAAAAAAATVACSKCSGQVPADAKFCTHCGNPMGPAMQTCPKCNAQIPADAKFCMNCGEKLAAAPAKCAKCGAELAAGQKFCMDCGTPVEG